MTVTVTFEVPAAIEEKLRTQGGDLSAEVKEAYALELYRQGQLNHFDLAQMLGLDQVETSELLQRHGIYRGSLTREDLEADYQTLKSLSKKGN